ncbi:putative DNA repair protein rev1 [Blattamonas nauphoetae]|uniref:DNA repair protein rev1 n=1 Tax=Blattamonas nauphoetae TaxID=2049346 RepID=A0ABQ9YH98_9EUKA|nr:putative DNA repair protein rev1 [Blattamonas nauphoetae]
MDLLLNFSSAITLEELFLVPKAPHPLFYEVTFFISSLSTVNRAVLLKLIHAHGGIVQSSWTSTINFVVEDDPNPRSEVFSQYTIRSSWILDSIASKKQLPLETFVDPTTNPAYKLLIKQSPHSPRDPYILSYLISSQMVTQHDYHNISVVPITLPRYVSITPLLMPIQYPLSHSTTPRSSHKYSPSLSTPKRSLPKVTVIKHTPDKPNFRSPPSVQQVQAIPNGRNTSTSVVHTPHQQKRSSQTTSPWTSPRSSRLLSQTSPQDWRELTPPRSSPPLSDFHVPSDEDNREKREETDHELIPDEDRDDSDKKGQSTFLTIFGKLLDPNDLSELEKHHAPVPLPEPVEEAPKEVEKPRTFSKRWEEMRLRRAAMPTSSIVPLVINQEPKQPHIPDPTSEQFVEQYLQNSRLSHMSQWKLSLTAFVERLLKDKAAHPDKESDLPIVPLPPDIQKQAASIVGTNFIAHIDMDCFFASVSLRSSPHLRNKPCVVCSAHNDKSTADISSANYPARRFGIKNGMWLQQAQALCNELVVLPYKFEDYETTSQQMFTIVAKFTSTIRVMSCDECIVDLTNAVLAQMFHSHTQQSQSGLSDYSDFLVALRQQMESGDTAGTVDSFSSVVTLLRRLVFEKTECTASVGMSTNPLLARLITNNAKPNGQSFISSADLSLIREMSVDKLPGIGWAHKKKLQKDFNVDTIGDLTRIPLQTLTTSFGRKIGTQMYERCRGIDKRDFFSKKNTIKLDSILGAAKPAVASPVVPKLPKTISVGMNYAIRFTEDSQAVSFLKNLINVTLTRLRQHVSSQTTSPEDCEMFLAQLYISELTLQMMETVDTDFQGDTLWAPTAKFLGHGHVNTFSRKGKLRGVFGARCDQPELMLETAVDLWKQLQIQPHHIRGASIQFSGLSFRKVSQPANINPPRRPVVSSPPISPGSGLSPSIDQSDTVQPKVPPPSTLFQQESTFALKVGLEQLLSVERSVEHAKLVWLMLIDVLMKGDLLSLGSIVRYLRRMYPQMSILWQQSVSDILDNLRDILHHNHLDSEHILTFLGLG